MPRVERPPGRGSLSDVSPQRGRPFPEQDVLGFLASGELRPIGQMPRASNATLLCELESEGATALAVYKPRDGESPLWDFPSGTLCLREYAAYLVSRAAGWNVVPPTVLRDGPYGFGAVSLFVEAEPGEHYLTLAERFPDHFRLVAALDVVINNADRKSGHCLLERSGERIWVVDHGVSFHAEPKLRTVIWDFAGERLSASAADGLRRVASGLGADLGAQLRDLLSKREVEALLRRVEGVLETGTLPMPRGSRPYPWPPV